MANDLSEKQVAEIRLNYPPGTRVQLILMEDSYAVPSGTRGSVEHVDDAGQIHMKWDNGRTLAIVPQVDQFRKLTQQEIMEEQKSYIGQQPKLLGYGASESPTELYSVKEVAKFIYENGQKGDVQICTEDGKPFISTFGVFLNQIASMEYRDALMKELVPLQMGAQDVNQGEYGLSQQM